MMSTPYASREIRRERSAQGRRVWRVLALGVLLSAVTTSAGQAQDLAWACRAGGVGFDGGLGIAVDNSGARTVTGHFVGATRRGHRW